MAAQVRLLPPGALLHPAFDPLRPWLTLLGEQPSVEEIDALAATVKEGVLTASGQRIRFCEPCAASGLAYEYKIFEAGVVDTRPDNRHDLFNALAWIAFPETKAALNARHVERLAVEGNARGPLRDLLTLLDEGGVIVACAAQSLAKVEALIRAFRWQELFWDARHELVETTRFVLLGHNAYEKALEPYPGITCKTLFVATPNEYLAGPMAALVGWLDVEAARWIQALPQSASPRQAAPLPVFGYPGWLPQSTEAGFYEDRRWFRPAPGPYPKPGKA